MILFVDLNLTKENMSCVACIKSWIHCDSYDYTQKGKIDEQPPKQSASILLTTVYQKTTDSQPTDQTNSGPTNDQQLFFNFTL